MRFPELLKCSKSLSEQAKKKQTWKTLYGMGTSYNTVKKFKQTKKVKIVTSIMLSVTLWYQFYHAASIEYRLVYSTGQNTVRPWLIW